MVNTEIVPQEAIDAIGAVCDISRSHAVLGSVYISKYTKKYMNSKAKHGN